MHIVLLILKLIGIILLCLLGLIILLLCLVLFVPVRYRVRAERTQEPEHMYARIKVTWFLHIVSAVISYEESLQYTIRIFGIKLLLGKKKAGKKKKKKRSGQKPVVHTETQPQALPETRHPVTVKTEERKKSNTKAFKKERQDKQSFFAKLHELLCKLAGLIKNFRETAARFFRKLSEIKNNFDYYVNAYEDKRNQAVIRLCLGQFGKIVKNIKPQKFRLALHIGMDDPAQTGQALAILGVVYPFFEKGLTVVPEFEKSVFEFDLSVKGRITVFVFLRAAWKIYFNRDFKRMLHILKKEAA